MKKRAIILLCVFAASQASILIILGPVGQILLQLQLSFDTEHYYALLSALDNNQYSRLLWHFIIDFIHPFIYASALQTWLLYFGPPVHQFWLRLPWIAATADILENFTALYLWTQFPREHDSLVLVGSSCSMVKWILVLIILVKAAHLCVANISRRPI